MSVLISAETGSIAGYSSRAANAASAVLSEAARIDSSLAMASSAFAFAARARSTPRFSASVRKVEV